MRMNTKDNILNKKLIIGWAIIIFMLSLAYALEVVKGERDFLYFICFESVAVIPEIIGTVVYRKTPASGNLKYIIISGFFLMYAFVMLTGNTPLIFTYIFPMLSLIVFYHQKRLILAMGIGSFIMNVIFVIMRVINDEITVSNSKEIEIQLALIILCFAASYVAAGFYSDIMTENLEYMKRLDDSTEQLKKVTFQSITTIANTIDAKDEYTKGHSQRVSEYSYELAKEIGLSESEAEKIKSIALLHDIGKIGVPDSVLNKPGKLSNEEFNIMKQHPVVGAEILKDINIVENLDIGAKYHHERFDGKGYPDGLTGEDIPFIARVISVADAYDAMSSNRVYRKRFSDNKILEELQKSKGTQFDPDIADGFIRLLEKKQLRSLSPDLPEDDVIKKQHIISENAMTNFVLPKEMEKEIIHRLKNTDGCMLLIDIDDMTDINQRYGYRKGDYYLSIIAESFSKSTDDITVSRIDGDEFLCYIDNVASIIDAEERAVKIINALNASLREYLDKDETITLSVGVSLSTVSGRDYSKLYIDADKALYHVKQNGKNGFYIYNDIRKETAKYMTKQDLNNLVKIIQEEYSYTGAFKIEYKEFEKVYEFVRNIGQRNAQTIQLILFTVKPDDEKHFSINDRINVMQYVEDAIIETVRKVDITTRYSSTQQLVMFMNLNEESIKGVIDRIMTEFYRMYDKNNVVLTYDIANLDFDKNE